jgi:S-adenosylmethionine hydrolase
MRRAAQAELHRISWVPEWLSSSFHGRDLFAPVAAQIALGNIRPFLDSGANLAMPGADWPDDLAELVYIDHYGNAMTGLRSGAVSPHAILGVADSRILHAATFAEVPEGKSFWYVNSNGLVEVAVNRGHAARQLGLEIGMRVTIEE